MKFEELCEKAYNLLLEDGFKGFYLIKELSDKYVFYGGDPDVAYYGLRTVYADKKTGEVKWFDINQHRKEIKESKEIKVPKEYIYNKAPCLYM